MKTSLTTILLSVGVLALGSCSSDSKGSGPSASTAAFCAAAQQVSDGFDALGPVALSGKPEEFEAKFRGLVADAQAALALAPADGKAVLQKDVDRFVELADVLEDLDWDFVAAQADPHANELISADTTAVDKYLLDTCRIDTDAPANS